MKYCIYCGQQIADEAAICRHCGCRPPNAANAGAGAQSTEPLTAVWSMICGIASFFIGWLVLGITAVVLANVSKAETGGELCNSAKVGYVCGLVSTGLSLVIVCVIIIILASI